MITKSQIFGVRLERSARRGEEGKIRGGGGREREKRGGKGEEGDTMY